MPVRSSGKIRCCPDKRSCNDTSNPMLSHKDPSCDLTVPIQFFDRNHIFMCCNLKYTVRRSIHDQRPCLYMLLPVIPDHVCSGVRLVAQNLPSRLTLKRIQHFLRKSIRIRRKRFWRDHSGNLPVPNRRIFPSGLLLHTCI